MVYQTIQTLKKGDNIIPIRLLKSISYIISNTLTDAFNNAINNGIFPENLKWANITPIFKKGDPTLKENYRPISILPTISKVFEKILYKQINDFMNNKLSKKLCGFRKNYSTQVALSKLLENWQSSLDKKEIVGTVLMDLSKAYDTIRHDLLIAKLDAYGFSNKALKFMYSYLHKRKQRVKIFDTFSKWLEITFGIPQGSILGPLLFNIFINDLFLFIESTDICNFADDNTLYTSDKNLETIINKLNIDILNLEKWFQQNSLVANPEKFQLMFIGTKESKSIFLNNIEIKASERIELLGLLIDNKLTFKQHVSKICKNANNKLSAINRLRNLINTSQTKSLINTHVLSYFFYCPLIWMFLNKNENEQINKVHKRSLKIIHNNYSSNFEELLLIDDSTKIHTRHLRMLMTEIYKITNNLSPELLSHMFKQKNVKYNMRDNLILQLPVAKTNTFGINSLVFKGSLVWNKLPHNIKTANSLSLFKSKIKNWDGKKCSCKICT